uniref:PDZ domain-containing protein n=1 Tax=Riptortus pedestris TaxID=329032 RepID=R4WU03_RIPPE|nr:conserved hypothetical protein [Riptortus pedestris]
MSQEKEYANSLRLCQIYKWDSFDGYGFNLHAEKGKPGQYIGKVDEGSPAEAAGLKERDRIIEVNSVNIANENHKQVVQRIKALPDVTTLLVVDPEGDSYYKSKNTVLKSTLPFVVHLKNPPEPPNKIAFDDNKNSEDSQSQKSTKSAQSSENETCLINNSSGNENENNTMDFNNQNNSLNLNMTAKELRAQLAAKKKYDPKKDHTIDFKKKI